MKNNNKTHNSLSAIDPELLEALGSFALFASSQTYTWLQGYYDELEAKDEKLASMVLAANASVRAVELFLFFSTGLLQKALGHKFNVEAGEWVKTVEETNFGNAFGVFEENVETLDNWRNKILSHMKEPSSDDE